MRFDDERYEEIKLAATELLCGLGAGHYPLDVRWLVERMGVQLVEYSSLPEPDRARMLALEPDGCTACLVDSPGRKGHRIAYNDSVDFSRQRFTLLHEIGHVVLGHKQSSELAEAEANFFAKFAIAPPALVNLIKPTDYMDIAIVFGTSAECAYYCMSYYRKWSIYAPKNAEYERMLLKQFTCTGEGGGVMLRREKGA